jgi:glutamine synthetase
MYFAISAIVAGGLLGLKDQVTEFPQKDVQINPSLLDEDQRLQFGVSEKMPGSLEEALEKLRVDGELRECLADGLVYDFLAMKEAEVKKLGAMDEATRRVWLIERY